MTRPCDLVDQRQDHLTGPDADGDTMDGKPLKRATARRALAAHQTFYYHQSLLPGRAILAAFVCVKTAWRLCVFADDVCHLIAGGRNRAAGSGAAPFGTPGTPSSRVFTPVSGSAALVEQGPLLSSPSSPRRRPLSLSSNYRRRPG